MGMRIKIRAMKSGPAPLTGSPRADGEWWLEPHDNWIAYRTCDKPLRWIDFDGQRLISKSEDAVGCVETPLLALVAYRHF